MLHAMYQCVLCMPLRCTVQVNYGDICTALQATSIQVTKSSQLVSLTTHMTYHPWGTLTWAESVTKVEEKVTKAIKAAIAGDKYDTPVLDAFNAVFEKSTLTPLKLKRFGSLKALLLSDLLPKRLAEAKKAASPVIYDMLQKALVQLNYDTALGSTFQQLDVGIRGCIIKYLIAHVKNRPLSLPDSFQLAEDDKVKKKRSRLTDKLSQIVTATDKIAHIEEAISVGSDTDFSPSSSSVHEIPDFSELPQEFAKEPYQEVLNTHAPGAAAAAAAPVTDELQMHAVPQESEHLPPPHSCGPETRSASSHSMPVPVSVAAQVNNSASESSHSAAHQGASGPSDTQAGRGTDTPVLGVSQLVAMMSSKTVFCKNIPWDATDEDVSGFFYECGKVTHCDLGMLLNLACLQLCLSAVIALQLWLCSVLPEYIIVSEVLRQFLTGRHLDLDNLPAICFQQCHNAVLSRLRSQACVAAMYHHCFAKCAALHI